MNETFSNTFKGDKEAIRSFVTNFDTKGEDFDERNRNALKIFRLSDTSINIKSFKTPHFINSIVYRFFRPSKARRSFVYAHKLLEKGIGTPQPIAFFEERSFWGLRRSYYVSNHLDYDLTYRDLIRDSEYEGNKEILEAFAAFTYDLHRKEIHFLDHSPGNTLIKIKANGVFDFFLVDLNRMKFGPLDFKTRMKNFERLSKVQEHIQITASAYAALSGDNPNKVAATMTLYILDFQNRFYRKKRRKKLMKFWEK